jgi:hypothetical protein
LAEINKIQFVKKLGDSWSSNPYWWYLILINLGYLENIIILHYIISLTGLMGMILSSSQRLNPKSTTNWLSLFKAMSLTAIGNGSARSLRWADIN